MKFDSNELSIFASTTVALLAIIDEDGNFLKKNDRWREEFDLTEEEDGLTVYELLLEKDREAFGNTLKELSEEAGASRYHFRFIGRNLRIHILQADLHKVGERVFIRATNAEEQDNEHRSLEQISKLAQTGAWFHNPLTNESHWSEQCYEIYGLQQSQEVSEDLVLSLFLKEDREELLRLIQRLYESFQPYEHLGRINHSSGEIRWIKTVAKPIVHDGKVLYVNGIAADVTERENLLEELQEQNRLKELALRGIRSGLFYHDLVKDEVSYGTEFKRMLGFPPDIERLPEEAFRALIYEPDRAEAYERHLTALANPGNYYFNHYRLTHISGQVKHYEVYAWKEFDADGKALRMVGNLINVDERVHAQQELKKYTKRLEAVVNNGFTYTFLLDLDGNVLLADENSIEFILTEFGIHPLSKPTHFTEVIPKSFDGSFRKEFERALKGVTVRKEIERVFSTGVSRWLDLMYCPVKDDDEVVTSVLLMFADISERKVAEVTVREARIKAEQLNAMKDNILSNLSHEIRTPMNGIMGGISLLEKYSPTEEQQEVLTMLRSCGDRLLDMLTSLVNLSKAKADQSTVVLNSMPLQELVSASFLRHQHMAERKKLGFHLKLPELPELILVNLEMFSVALDHLINNAIKYTHEGNISVQAEVKKEEGVVEISVEDTGMGIEEHNLARIFEDFIQESTGLDRRFEGTGIGLSLTKRLIEQMGGTISVASIPGKGSKFSLKIPLGK